MGHFPAGPGGKQLALMWLGFVIEDLAPIGRRFVFNAGPFLSSWPLHELPCCGRDKQSRDPVESLA